MAEAQGPNRGSDRLPEDKNRSRFQNHVFTSLIFLGHYVINIVPDLHSPLQQRFMKESSK